MQIIEANVNMVQLLKSPKKFLNKNIIMKTTFKSKFKLNFKICL